MPCKHTKSPFLYVYKKTKNRFVWVRACQLFQVYFTTIELEMKNIINSLCFKSFINKKSGPLGTVEGASAPVVSPPTPHGPVP